MDPFVEPCPQSRCDFHGEGGCHYRGLTGYWRPCKVYPRCDFFGGPVKSENNEWRDIKKQKGESDMGKIGKYAISRVCKMREDGMSIPEIAEKMGWKESSVCRALQIAPPAAKAPEEPRMVTVEEAREIAAEAGIPFSDKPYDADEEPNPYVYDGSMSPEDYEKWQERCRADAAAKEPVGRDDPGAPAPAPYVEDPPTPLTLRALIALTQNLPLDAVILLAGDARPITSVVTSSEYAPDGDRLGSTVELYV